MVFRVGDTEVIVSGCVCVGGGWRGGNSRDRSIENGRRGWVKEGREESEGVDGLSERRGKELLRERGYGINLNIEQKIEGERREREREREREIERERETETERETDRDRQTDRQTDSGEEREK